jgi:GNAT superfamily N-acetyltransferase
MSAELKIQRLSVVDAAAFVALRRMALETAPLAFGASADDDVGLVLESVRNFLGDHEGQAVFGQFDGADLIGTVGLIRASKVKQRHKATIWGMYVLPRARNKGVGRALLDAAIQHARGWGLDHLQLSVTEAALTAKRLYEAAGFSTVGARAARVALEGALPRRVPPCSQPPRTAHASRRPRACSGQAEARRRSLMLVRSVVRGDERFDAT